MAKRTVIQHKERGTLVSETPSMNPHSTLAEWRPSETNVPKDSANYGTWDQAWGEWEQLHESYRAQYEVVQIEIEMFADFVHGQQHHPEDMKP